MSAIALRAILVLTTLLVMLILAVIVNSAKAEFCKSKIDNTIERVGGYRWQFRIVDNKKCWYYSNRLLPREDLVWSFSEEEFNSDIQRIIERKFYKPILDENQLLIEVD